MTFKRLLGLAVATVAVAALVGSVGAGAARTPAKPAVELSTNAKVREHLRSLGISPRGVVIQRGARNYAGPRCPGKRWTCTRSHRVVQVATGRGKNRFRCSVARCVVVQVTKSLLAASTATCVRTTGITQSCSITQTGTGPNEARVYMNAKKTTGLTQNASQTATIAQTGSADGTNKACVSQIADIEGTTTAKRGVPVTVTLDAHQSISISQSSQSGSNTLSNANSNGTCGSNPLKQSQLIVSKANGSMDITQNENTLGSTANMFVDVSQNSGSGPNLANLDQTNTLAAIAIGPGPVNQTQSTVDGGIDARINQFSHGVSTSTVNQTENQCVHAQTSGTVNYQPPPAACPTGGTQPASLNQVQHGPVRKGTCCSTQADNDANEFHVFQTSKQDSDGGSVDQDNTIETDCSTTGNCMTTQTATVDGQSTTNVQSGQDIDTTMSCTGDNCNPTCSGSSCTTFTESGSQFAATNVDVAESGAGGMRGGDGTGSITVSGVDGAVAKAFLYWNGPTNSSDPTVNALVSFGGTPVTGTNIGISGDNNWGFLNSQSYRADVTGLVTGNGTYALANFTKADADINGVALVVFYVNDSVADNRNVVLWNGNDSNCLAGGVPENWDETITGVPYNGGTATLDLIVGDGQSFTDGEVDINGLPFIPAGQNFDGDSVPPNAVGGLWDVRSFSGLESFLPAASNDLHLTSPAAGDCLSLVVAAANVPASGPVILAPTAAPTAARTRTSVTAPAPSVAAGSGGVAR